MINFVKVSYPDAIGAVSPFSVEYDNLIPEREPLLESGHRVCRSKISQNVRNLLGESPPFDRTVVFDLDKLVREGGAANGDTLSNDDAERVLETRSKDSNARW